MTGEPSQWRTRSSYFPEALMYGMVVYCAKGGYWLSSPRRATLKIRGAFWRVGGVTLGVRFARRQP
jgi:hypothetical protein